MKKIGLVGGLSWLSTLEYYRAINLNVAGQLGKHHSAPVLVESLDRQAFLDAALADSTERECATLIVNAFKTLQVGGAEVFAVCANGIHRFESIIREETGIEIQNIATATAAHASTMRLERVGLLGVAKTMESTFFQHALRLKDIDTVVPLKSDREIVHRRITEELVLGEIRETTRSEFKRISSELADNGAQAIIMGCTEIPLMFMDNKIGDIPALSTTQIHCDAIVEAAL